MNNKYEEIPVSELPPEDVSTGFSDLVFLIHEGGNCMGYYDFNLNAWMARIRSSPIRVTPTAWMRKLPPTDGNPFHPLWAGVYAPKEQKLQFNQPIPFNK